VLQADKLGLDYGLRLPGKEIPPDAGEAHRAAAWRRWRCAERIKALPRDARDTLFLLAVIAWLVLPQVGNLPWWCTALAAACCLARHAGRAQRALPGNWWVLGLLAARWPRPGITHRTLLGRDAGRDADRGAAGAEDAGAARAARRLRHLLPELLHDAHQLLLLAVAADRGRCWWGCWAC
jgi:hypothetical protein